MRRGDFRRRERLAVRLFRGCLRLYPADFRLEEADDMVATFERRLTDRRRGLVGRVWLPLRECGAVVRGGLGARLARRGAGGGGPAAPNRAAFRPWSHLRRTVQLIPDLGSEFRQAARALARKPGVA